MKQYSNCIFVILSPSHPIDSSNNSIVLYNNIPEANNEKQSEEEDFELGKLSYYYPPFDHSNFMEVVTPDSHESEEGEVNLQEQMRETGMRGMPLPDLYF